jgi:hypothetical protein
LGEVACPIRIEATSLDFLIKEEARISKLLLFEINPEVLDKSHMMNTSIELLRMKPSRCCHFCQANSGCILERLWATFKWNLQWSLQDAATFIGFAGMESRIETWFASSLVQYIVYDL